MSRYIEKNPVGAKMVKKPEDYQYSRANLVPDIEHAVELMRLVYENRDLTRRISERASKDIKRDFSPEATGKKIANRLERIINNYS